jgi:hypothetical protein
MMFKRVLLLFAVMAALFVAPVVAYDNETEIYEEFYRFEKFKSHDTHYKSTGVSLTALYIPKIENYVRIQTVFYRPYANAEKWVEVASPSKITGIEPVTLRYDSRSGPIIAKGTVSYYRGDTPSNSHVRLDLDTWYDDVVGDDRGSKYLYIELPVDTNLRAIGTRGNAATPKWIAVFDGGYRIAGHYQVEYTASFQHRLTLTEESSESYRLTYFREFGKKHDSIVTITDRYGNVTGPYHDSVTKYVIRDKSLSPFLVNVESTEFGAVYKAYLGPGNFTFDPEIPGPTPTPVPTPSPGGETCMLVIYDADTRLPLTGNWTYYCVVKGSPPVEGVGRGSSAVLKLPVTSILEPHLLRVTKEGYEQTSPLAFDVPVGGREVNVYLTPLNTTAPEGSSVVTFIVTDIETGAPRGQCLVNVDGVGKYAGASGSVWFVLPENTTHQWLVTAEGYWPIGGDFTLGVDDLVIPVEMTKKTSELPRPPMPGIPGLPVIHPSLDPAGFRMQILNVPILGDLASPLLDTVDRLGVGLDDIAIAVLDVLTAPADQITGAVSSVSQNLIDTATPYLVTSSLLLQVIGAAVSCLPAQVTGLVTFGLVLDIVRILLWGPA